jgi:Phage integrase, N-terminal SAM-like domain
MNAHQAIDRMRQVIRRQHKALSTEHSYIQWLRRYVKALRQMPPGLSSEKKLETFLTDLARERDVSASTGSPDLAPKYHKPKTARAMAQAVIPRPAVTRALDLTRLPRDRNHSTICGT